MYNIKNRKRFGFLLILLFVFSLIFTPELKALELVVSGNGESSQSEINFQVETQTTVEQVNEANVANDVSEELDTGGNEVSGNSGDVNVYSGDVSSETSIDNNLNTSYVETDSCCSTSDIQISDNGSGSDNRVSFSQESETNITTQNTADILNTVHGSANTGENKVNNSTDGAVNIETGDISASSKIENGPVNASVIAAESSFYGATVKVDTNGPESVNSIDVEFSDDVNIYLNHSSDLENYILWEAETGENEVSGNTGGDVKIETGDVDIETFIKNLVNIGGVDIECCEVDKDGDGDNNDGGDPNDGDKDDDKDKDNGNDDGDGDENGNDAGGSILPSAAATEAGGPGIMGLSDTSSSDAKTLFFWISLIFVSLGGKIIIEELLNDTSSKKSVK